MRFVVFGETCYGYFINFSEVGRERMSETTRNDKPDRLHPVTITVNRRHIDMPDNHATGIEIKTAADVPATFKLFDPHGDEIANDQDIKIHNNEKFTAISGQDVS